MLCAHAAQPVEGWGRNLSEGAMVSGLFSSAVHLLSRRWEVPNLPPSNAPFQSYSDKRENLFRSSSIGEKSDV